MNSSSITRIVWHLKHLHGITIVATLMILFGLAEVLTGFSHNFIGLVVTSATGLSTFLGAVLGAFYFLAGLLILTNRKWAGTLALVLLSADVIGRITMVLTGLYPVDTFLQIFSIVVGTAIAIFFAVYIGVKWKVFI